MMDHAGECTHLVQVRTLGTRTNEQYLGFRILSVTLFPRMSTPPPPPSVSHNQSAIFRVADIFCDFLPKHVKTPPPSLNGILRFVGVGLQTQVCLTYGKTALPPKAVWKYNARLYIVHEKTFAPFLAAGLSSLHFWLRDFSSTQI